MKDRSQSRLVQTVDLHMQGLDRLKNMWLDPNVLFYEDEVPKKKKSEPTIFLAGPTSRDGIPEYMWRKEAVHFLRYNNCTGKILVPEPRGYSYLADRGNDDFTDSGRIHEWEYLGINRATFLLFWVPRNMQQLLGITTNREFGQAIKKAQYSKVFSRDLYIGWPDDAKKMGSMQFELEKAKVGHLQGGHFTSLESMCNSLGFCAVCR